MQSYTKVYLQYFKYTIADFIPCEVCGNQATEIHHIEARSKRKDLLNDIKNLVAICRRCHEIYGDKKQFENYLKEIHNERIQRLQ